MALQVGWGLGGCGVGGRRGCCGGGRCRGVRRGRRWRRGIWEDAAAGRVVVDVAGEVGMVEVGRWGGWALARVEDRGARSLGAGEVERRRVLGWQLLLRES